MKLLQSLLTLWRLKTLYLVTVTKLSFFNILVTSIQVKCKRSLESCVYPGSITWRRQLFMRWDWVIFILFRERERERNLSILEWFSLIVRAILFFRSGCMLFGDFHPCRSYHFNLFTLKGVNLFTLRWYCTLTYN